ncbi:MAG: 30S ribosomal protein S16 [Parcubacteria group bacterium]|nr:30S ribosomal protein S16 [Parcubacteria group bacterium]
MLKIRLQRVGRKNDPSFRVVCTDSRKGPKSGNNVEILGAYDPKRDNVAIKGDRVEHWISQGAQVSDTVNNILRKEGIIKTKKKHVSRGKKNTRTPEAEEVKTEEAVEAEGDAPVTTEEAPLATDAPAEEEKQGEAPVEEAEAPKEEVSTEEVVEEKKEVV